MCRLEACCEEERVEWHACLLSLSSYKLGWIQYDLTSQEVCPMILAIRLRTFSGRKKYCRHNLRIEAGFTGKAGFVFLSFFNERFIFYLVTLG